MSLKDKEARAVYNQEYHAKHREKILAQQQIYRKNNLLSLQKKEKQYAEQHREQCLVQKRRAYQQNPEKFKQRVVVYQKRAPDKMREMRRRVKRKYRKKHPGLLCRGFQAPPRLFRNTLRKEVSGRCG